MSYQVIARKWRPQAFEEVTGQEPITRTLRNAIEHERLHHAYLFSGARGVGKTTTARLLAKALNCHKSEKPAPTPCAVTDPTACPSCREIAEGRSIDVLEIDAASNTGVDNVRESIINTVGVRPARDRYKVFIIDEVHMLSGAAFNALLKTLEEPPSRVVFIMATTEAHKLPDTILSRCQQFEFRTISGAKIADRLRLIANAEGISIAEDALREIARAGEGSMRDAQSAFDQVISFSGEQIKTEDVEAALGLASTELLRRTMRAVADQTPAEAIAVVEDLTMRGHDLRNFTRDLLAYVRDLLTTRITNDGTRTASQSDLETADRETGELAARFSESDLVRFFHSLTQTEKDLRESAHPRYQLEVGLVKLIEMGKLARLDDVLHRLTDLEERMRSGAASSMVSGGGAPPVAGSGSNIPPRRAGSGGGAGTPRPSFAPPTPSPPPAAAFQSVEPSATASVIAPPLKLVTPAAQSPVNAHEPDAFTLSADSVVPNPPALSPATSAVVPPPASVAAPVRLNSDSSPVERIMAELERRRPFVAFALGEAQRVVIEGNEFCVVLTPKTRHLRDNLTQPESRKALIDVCREVTGCEMGLKISIRDPQEIADGNEQENEQELARRQAEEERAELWRIAEADPTIQEFKRIFRGEITDVWREPASGAPDAQS